MQPKISKKEKMVLFSALMHDIGKPIAWLDSNHPIKKTLRDLIRDNIVFEYSHSHELYSIAIVKYWIYAGKLKNAPAGIEWTLRHHIPERGSKNYGIEYNAPELRVQEIKEISNIVSEADKISSAAERVNLGEFDDEYDGKWFVSPFMEVSLGKPKEITKDMVLSWVRDGRVYKPISVGDFIAGDNGGDLEKIANGIISDFEFDFEQFDVDYLLSFLMYYTTFLPSASPYRSPHRSNFIIPDISLYAHSKLTAAIAHAMLKSRDGLRMYVVDISGIQSFISSTPRKHAAKLLKAKSIYIKIVEDAVSRAIAAWHGLTLANIIFSSGGKAYVLTNIRDKADEAIREIQKEIFRKTNGRLHATVTYMDYTIDEIKNSYTVLESIENKLREEKKRKYWRIKDIIFGEETEVLDSEQCQLCGRQGSDRAESEEMDEEESGFYLCDDCNEIWELAKSLKFLSRDISSPSKILIDVSGKVNFSFNLPEKKITIGYSLNTVKGFDPFPSREFNGKFMFMSVAYPMENGKIKSFDKFADDNKIYVLKGDVDNLGYIFSKGLEYAKAGNRTLKTLSRQLTMSYILDLFFSGRLTKIAYEYNEKGRNIYVLFSGGDDFSIIGDKTVIDFLDDIKREFKRTVISDEITFSASITRHRTKKPFKYMYGRAEEALSDAKNHPMLTIPLVGHNKKGIIHMIWFDRLKGKSEPLSYAIEAEIDSSVISFFDNKTKKMKIKHFLDRFVVGLSESLTNWDFYRLHYYLVRNFDGKDKDLEKIENMLIEIATAYKLGLDRFNQSLEGNEYLREGLSKLNIIRAMLKLASEEGE